MPLYRKGEGSAISGPALVELLNAALGGTTWQQGGAAIEFRTTSTHLQWRAVGDEDWIDLISIDELGGITDHGLLDGLGDDDHPQYATADGSRGNFASVAAVVAAHVAADTGIAQSQDALDGLQAHSTNTSNPHSVTKAQVGLSNVDNTSDAAKPVSTATQTALDGKSNTGHTHDDRYYTEGEMDVAIANLGDLISTTFRAFAAET